MSYFIPTVCAQEVLQSAKDEKELKLLKDYLESQNLLDPKDACQTHFDAARIFFDCRRKGLTIRSSTDCFIACLCLNYNASLLHNDSDYQTIARVRPLKFFS